MAIPRPLNQFDPGRELNPSWPPAAPREDFRFPFVPPSVPIPPRTDPIYDDSPQFLEPYVPPGPGQQSPFQTIPTGPENMLPPSGPYIASLPPAQQSQMGPATGDPRVGNPRLGPAYAHPARGLPPVPPSGPYVGFQQNLQQMNQMWPQTQQQRMRDFIMNSAGPAPPGGVSPGMQGGIPGMGPGSSPFYGPPQTSGAAPSFPDMSNYPPGMSPGMPGSGFPSGAYDNIPGPGAGQYGGNWTWPQRFDLPTPNPTYPSLGDVGNMMMPGIPGGM